MKKLFFLPILALLFLAMSSCEKDQLAPATPSYELVAPRTNATVPFHGEYAVDVILYFDPTTGIISADLDAVGKARHLGRSTWVSFSNIYPDGVQDGDMTFTAADGSQLKGFFLGTADESGGSGDYQITEGTYRFEGATGTGTYFWINVADGPNYLEFNGTLTNP